MDNQVNLRAQTTVLSSRPLQIWSEPDLDVVCRVSRGIQGVQGVQGVHGFQGKISNGAFHPVAVAKDRTDTEKFTIALSARWPWQETVPKRKNFHRCTFSPVAVEEDRTKMEKFPPVPFSPLAMAKNRAKTEKFPPVHFQLGGRGEKASQTCSAHIRHMC